jgi:CubicO group peptidase (beta-lactamase class C family)
MRTILKVTALALIFALPAGHAQSTASAQPPARAAETLPARLQAFMDAQASLYGFSGAVLVRKGDQVLLRKAYGLADREWGVPNGLDTRFRIASASKAFTAVAIMKLVEIGRLSLDDRLERFLPGFPKGDSITIRMMLNHSSGLARNHDMDIATDIEMTREKALPIVRAKPLAFEPGSQVGYSNTAFLLLSWIIEDVSGKSFSEFMEENVFRPAGLRDTGIYDPTNLTLRRARHYWFENPGAGGPAKGEMWPNYSMFQGHGNLYSTVDDLARFLDAFKGSGLLTRGSVTAMMTAQGDSPWGLGLELPSQVGHRAFGHGGSFNGARVDAWAFQDDDVTAVIISNNAFETNGMVRALAALTFGQEVDMPSRRTRTQVAPAILARYAGTYGRGDIIFRDGKLMIGETEMIPESQTKFFELGNPNHTYEFVLAPDGKVTAVLFGRYGLRRSVPRRD